jgi:uncharacterized membrane protein YjgN (DUF898 family)
MTMSQPQPPAESSSPQPVLYDHDVEFTGSGSEYFRIWIVNTLLILVTLGLYLPWAKARKLQYFYSNTSVDGYALDFLGNPRKMFRGMMIAGLFLGLYSKALDVSLLAWAIATLALVCVWPMLFRASMQFRLANTSWRGLRFRFSGDVRESYLSVGLALALVVVPFGLMQWAFVPDSPKATPNVTALVTSYVLVFSSLVLVLPYLFWRIKRYQHANYCYGSEQAEFRIEASAVYGVVLKTILLAVLLGLAVAGLSAAMAYLSGGGGLRKPGPGMIVWLMFQTLVFVILFNVLVKCYWTVSVQNLIWSRTGNNRVRFVSRLSFKPYAWLQLKNYSLIVVTLGLYWPFAVISTRRLVLESMTVRTRGISLDALRGQASDGHDDAAGDAAADLFGMDVGL